MKNKIERLLQQKLKALFTKFPVIFLTGPRQSGKTTLCRAAFPHMPYVNLEDLSLLAALMEDPHGFLKQYENGVILDEAQNFPDIFSYIQVYADERNRPGQYILTGSQNFLLSEKISQTLCGRVGILELLPLAYSEMSSYCFSNLADVIFRGCYPRLHNEEILPADFFSAYVRTYLERDVRQIKNISSLNQFHKFLTLCAGRVGQVVNLSALSSDCGLSVPTMKEWLSILEASYVIYLLHPYSININRRMVKMPKIYFCDTGILCNLLGIKSTNDLRNHFSYGNIFENFVITEFLKAQFNGGERKNLYFLRDARGHEIDCLVADSGGNLLCEIKSSSTFDRNFIKNILYYKELDSTARGFVIYNGTDDFEFNGVKIIPFEHFPLKAISG